jgi:hypothetical protein
MKMERMKIMINYVAYYKNENVEVTQLALSLKKFLEQDDIQHRIDSVHKINGKSQDVQKIIDEHLLEFGFVSEKQHLFKKRNLRPDMFNEKFGIMVEVERGKIKSNNMHLLDLWKCHINPETKHLFLIIPNSRQRNFKKATPIFKSIIRDVESFFTPPNYINDDSCYVFGY